ncbi:MAG: Peptidase [Acidobacteriaceae bacterium]|nr:Peptidase [Acidobacteriaceae bacterium]
MSISPTEQIRNCKSCASDLAPGALACANCHTLVHAQELACLTATAKTLENDGQLRQAREQWLFALQLLPPSSKQADWIKEKTHALEIAAEQTEVPESENKWANKLGPVGPIAIVLAKSKALLVAVFKLKFLLSFASFLFIYWALYGPLFGAGFASMILIHEMGHFLDIKRRGLPAEMPVFMPGLGAYVRWQALGVPLETRAEVSLAGPLAGYLACVACGVIWWQTHNGVWAALARSGAWLNIMNLIPVWVLDGGQAALALDKTERILLLTACLGLWLFLGENVFFLVALGAGWRLFTKDMPVHGSRRTAIFFLAVLTLLGLVLRLMPGQGFGAI